MVNDISALVKTLTSAQILAGLGAAAEETQAQLFNYLSFSGRDGKFEINKKADSADAAPRMEFGTRLLVNILESKKGYVCWKNQAVVDTIEGPLVGWALPAEDALPDHGPYPDQRDGWSKQFTIIFKDAVSNKQYQFKTSSKSGVNQVGTMIQEIFEQGALHDLAGETPVVEIGGSRFKSQGHFNWKPVFTLVEWAKNPEPVALTVTVPAEQAALPAPDEAGDTQAAPAIDATRAKKK